MDERKKAKQKRPGNKSRKEVKRPTETEIEERIQFAINLRLNTTMYKCEQKVAIAERFGVTRKTAEEYLGRAKVVMNDQRNRDTSELMDEAYLRLRGHAVSDEASRMERIKAETEIIKLMGLASPTKHAITDSEGNDISIDEAGSELSALASALADRSGEDSGS